MNSPYNFGLLIRNTKSSGSGTASDDIAATKSLFARGADELTLKKQDFEKPDRLRRNLQKLPDNSLVLISGGDGTVNIVISAYLSLAKRPTVTFLPLDAGNASDIANMVHSPEADNLAEIIMHGKQRKAYALAVTINDESQKYALAYVSFGASAAVMQRLDGLSRRIPIFTNHRLLRLFAEASLSLYSLFRAPLYNASVNGHDQRCYDILFINGSRIAKYYRTKARLTDISFARIIINRKHPVLLGHLWKLVRHRATADTTTKTYEIMFETRTAAQLDGDAFEIASGSRVEIAKEVQPYNVLSYTSLRKR